LKVIDMKRGYSKSFCPTSLATSGGSGGAAKIPFLLPKFQSEKVYYILFIISTVL
jgi:hypothetical protein